MPQVPAAATLSSQIRGNPSLIDNLSRLKKAILLVTSIAVLLQLTIFFSTDNLVASALLLCGLFVGLNYSLNRQLLSEYPLSTLAVLGYTISYFVIPPLGQLIGFQSILHNLSHHILVWVYGLAGMLAIVIAHYAYRVFSPFPVARSSLSRYFYRPLRFFEMPNPMQFWLMGFMGIAATIINVKIAHGGSTTTLSSIMRVFRPLVYTPYFIAFPSLIDPRYKGRRRPFRVDLIVYSLLLIAVAAMTNSRAFMFTGFASMGVVYLYRVMTGTISPPRMTLRTATILGICAWIVSGPFTNIAASMIVARRLRTSVSPRELAVTTWSIYRSGLAARSVENLQHHTFTHYDETYFGNIFLDRLANVRYTDISIEAKRGVESLGETSYFKKVQLDRVIAILPEPVIKAMHIEINKKYLLSGSSEDFLYELATGRSVGGFKTGFPLVILSATFGLMWPILFTVIAVLAFITMDALCETVSLRDNSGNRVHRSSVFNPMVAGTLFGFASYFTAFGGQDIAAYVSFLTRGWIETGLVYACAFMLTKGVSWLTIGWIWRADNVPQAGA